MPKEIPKPRLSRKARAPRKKSSTQERLERAERVRNDSKEMAFRCERCVKKNLRCFVDTVSGRCAGCIAATAECELFVPEEEWEKVEQEKREKRLELLRVRETAARVERELAEIESREQEFARRDLAIAKAQRQGQEADTSSATIPSGGFDQLADSGWSQANNPLPDPSMDLLLNDFLSGSPPSVSESFPWFDDTVEFGV